MSNSTPSSRQSEHELPVLAGISGFFRWLESLLTVVSGPVLTAGLAISLIDLLTDGALLASSPGLLYAWAGSQAVGIDAGLVSAFDRGKVAFHEHRYGALVGNLILGCLLAYVGWAASYTFAVGQADHVSTANALATIGLDRFSWLIIRSALGVFLVCLSGWQRYHAPKKESLTLDQELEAINREKQLTAARASLNEVRAAAAVGLGRKVLSGIQGKQQHAESPSDPNPVGPGSPAVASSEPDSSDADGTDEKILPLTPATSKRREGRKLSPAALQARAYKLLETEPGMSSKKLSKLLHVRWDKGDQLRKSWLRSKESSFAL